MKKIYILLLKITFMLVFLSIIVYFLDKIYVENRRTYEYLTVLNDKHLMAQNAPNNKILIVGASSSSFGLSSDTLEKHLGKPVYNLALLAPLGSKFILEYSAEKVKENDIVLLSFEYEKKRFAFLDEQLLIDEYYTFGNKNHDFKLNSTENIKAFVLHKVKNMRNFFWDTFTKNYMKEARIEDTTSVYFRKAFSEKGDILSHLNNPSKAFDKLNFPKDSIDYSETIFDMNIFIEKVKSKKGKVFFIFPPIAKTTFEHGEKAIFGIENELRKTLECQIIGKPADFVYEDKYFFDSFYHLNGEGVKLRNTKLVELLKPFFKIN